MMTLKREHHRQIMRVLECFDADMFAQQQILFGGGTRIAMELDEYRESVDVDFFCVGAAAYRAVRSQVSHLTLGSLVRHESGLRLAREVRTDRDAVRTFVFAPDSDVVIKLEFLHFDLCAISQEKEGGLFPVPVVDKLTCYVTKLLANADRFRFDIKDILDLCMMRQSWGAVPVEAWDAAVAVYGVEAVKQGVVEALLFFSRSPQKAVDIAITKMGVEPQMARHLVMNVAKLMMQEVDGLDGRT